MSQMKVTRSFFFSQVVCLFFFSPSFFGLKDLFTRLNISISKLFNINRHDLIEEQNVGKDIQIHHFW